MIMTPDTSAHVALRELAIETGIIGLEDPSRIKNALILQRCDRESLIRQLEGKIHVLERLTIHALKGDLRSAKIDRDAWSTRAVRAENALWWAYGGIIGLAVALVAALAHITALPPTP